MSVSSVVVTATLAFAATNGDDFIVLLGLQTLARTTSRPSARQIVVGQYLGFSLLVAVCALAGQVLANVPTRWLGLLGLVAVGLGLRALFTPTRTTSGEVRDQRVAPAAILGVSLLTIVNGADNVVVYSVLFRRLDFPSAVLTTAVFAALLAAWCAASYGVARLMPKPSQVGEGVRRIIPIMMIAVGLVILSHTLTG